MSSPKPLTTSVEIDPRACRRHVEQNFGPDKMVAGYEQVYRDCLGEAARDQTAVADGHS